MKEEGLTRKIIGCAFKVHNALGQGFLERVYETRSCNSSALFYERKTLTTSTTNMQPAA